MLQSFDLEPRPIRRRHFWAVQMPVPAINSIRLMFKCESDDALSHEDMFKLIWWGVIDLFRSIDSFGLDTDACNHVLLCVAVEHRPGRRRAG